MIDAKSGHRILASAAEMLTPTLASHGFQREPAARRHHNWIRTGQMPEHGRESIYIEPHFNRSYPVSRLNLSYSINWDMLKSHYERLGAPIWLAPEPTIMSMWGYLSDGGTNRDFNVTLDDTPESLRHRLLEIIEQVVLPYAEQVRHLPTAYASGLLADGSRGANRRQWAVPTAALLFGTHPEVVEALEEFGEKESDQEPELPQIEGAEVFLVWRAPRTYDYSVFASRVLAESEARHGGITP